MDKKNARKARQRKLRNRRIALTLCLMLTVAVASIGGTIAWLTASTTSVVNTFTAGDINIELKEHDYIQSSNTLDLDEEVTSESDYKMIPGNVLPKDPFVTVEANSEACWLFVKVEKGNNVDNYLDYAIAGDWITLPNEEDVYYRSVSAADTAQTFYVLKGGDPANPNGQVTVKSTVTEAMLETAETTKPTLTFTAYAIQSANISNAADAWTKITA